MGSTFRFKQFEIEHTASAMKVGTDGVLLGAWAEIPSSAISILDVGTGSGLIALMMAQRTTAAEITAVEIDDAAAAEARSNVLRSVWSDRISVINMTSSSAILHFSLKTSSHPIHAVL